MGKLIVLEGIDGSGKSTQFRILTERLRAAGTEFATVSFPRYDDASSALIKMYLGGEFGNRPGDVNAYAASTLFAVDRFASYKREEWGRHYDNGGLVVMDRYTTSNAVHQGAKLDKADRRAFFRWLYDFEFRLIGLPKPDMVIYMDIDAETSIKRLGDRPGAEDIHERDADYLRSCAECAGQAAQEYGWICVDAAHDLETVSAEIESIFRFY